VQKIVFALLVAVVLIVLGTTTSAQEPRKCCEAFQHQLCTDSTVCQGLCEDGVNMCNDLQGFFCADGNPCTMQGCAEEYCNFPDAPAISPLGKAMTGFLIVAGAALILRRKLKEKFS